MISFGGRKPGLVLLWLAVSALGTLAVAQTVPVKLVLRASEPIQPVLGASILGRYWTSDGTRGVVPFYPVPGSGQRDWKATLPSLPAPANVDIYLFPGTFQDLAGNLNEQTLHCRVSARTGIAQSSSPSFWQLH
jgi:hypothetical protein